jgi:hypothetical protein
VLVADAEKDLLRDRTADYVARLRAMGKPVELVEFEGQGHGFFVYEATSRGAPRQTSSSEWYGGSCTVTHRPPAEYTTPAKVSDLWYCTFRTESAHLICDVLVVRIFDKELRYVHKRCIHAAAVDLTSLAVK